MLTKIYIMKAMVFPVSMYRCERWTIKGSECWRIDAFELWYEKTLGSPLDCKETQPVSPEGNWFWRVIGKTDAEAPILLPPEVKSWFIWKDRDAGKDWREEEKGMTEDEMFGWHHGLNGHEFEQGLGYGEGQGSLSCYSPCSRRESDRTERLNNNNIRI